MDSTKTPEADEATTAEAQETEAQAPAESETFESASFQSADPGQPAGGATIAENLDTVLDVPITLSLEVGRTQLSVGDLLKLSQGSVVELNRPASEPLDVMVNGTLVARGEIVMINDRFGIRLMEVIKPEDRPPPKS